MGLPLGRDAGTRARIALAASHNDLPGIPHTPNSTDSRLVFPNVGVRTDRSGMPLGATGTVLPSRLTARALEPMLRAVARHRCGPSSRHETATWDSRGGDPRPVHRARMPRGVVGADDRSRGEAGRLLLAGPPDGADRERRDAIVDHVRKRSGVKNGAEREPITEPIT